MISSNPTFGWHGKILKIDLASGETETLNTLDYADRFIGGRGILSKLYWDSLQTQVDAFHPDSPLIFMTGPLTGTPAIGGSRLNIGGRSPFQHPDQYGVANIGGSFGPRLKATGIDGLVITGQAPGPCYLHIADGQIEIKDATGLWGLSIKETFKRLKATHGKKSRSLGIGPAGENRVRFATIMDEVDSSAASGFAAVMGSKNLKAITATGSVKTPVARPDELNKINKEIRRLTEGKMLVPPNIPGIEQVKFAHCPGCQVGCGRGLYRHEASGREGYLKNCQSAYMYHTWDQRFHEGESSDDLFLATAACNDLGLCTQELCNLFRWLNDCQQNGVLGDDSGLAISQIGSMGFFNKLTEQIVSRKGIGDLLAEGTVRAAQSLGEDAEKLAYNHVSKSGFHNNTYNPRFFNLSTVFYATESTSNINQLHDFSYPLMKWNMWLATDGHMSKIDTDVIRKMAKRFWQDEKAADFSTYEGTAAAAKRIQDRGFAKENLIVCDFLFPITIAEGADDFVGDPTLESRLLSAVTGIDFTEDSYLQTGDRSFNLQRAIHAVEGCRTGRGDDTLSDVHFEQPHEWEEGFFGIFNPEFLVPGPDGEIISRKGAVVDRGEFVKLMDEYYDLRGWDVQSGLQKEKTLNDLGLEDTVPALKRANCLADADKPQVGHP
jgi:aldehyde:ferredoxin oxidoreductase